MAAVQTVIDTLESVPEALRGFYVPGEGGKFKLDGIEDTGALKRSMENAKKERNEAKSELDKFKDVDREEYAKLKKDAEEREVQSATKKGEYEKLLKQVQDRQKTELDARDKREAALRSAVESYLVDSEATRALAAAKGVPELLLPHARAQIKVFEENGKFAAKVVDKDGNPRIGDANGAPMTIDQLVAEMRGSEVYGRAFEGTGASGGGAQPNRSNAGGGQDLSKLSPTARMDAARAQRKSA